MLRPSRPTAWRHPLSSSKHACHTLATLPSHPSHRLRPPHVQHQPPPAARPQQPTLLTRLHAPSVTPTRPRHVRSLATLPPSTSTSTSAPDSAAPAQPNALQATDPLLIYYAKVARGELEEDEEQLRALVQLRRINRALRDYIPPAHLLGILNHDTAHAEAYATNVLQQQRRLARRAHGANQPSAPEVESNRAKEKIGELVRWLSDSEGLAELGTPKGLMITGTPGTGKSMVINIFYDSLPTKHKFRRHYHHLLLDLYKIIWDEAERRRIALRYGGPRKTVAPSRGLGGVWVRDAKANKATASGSSSSSSGNAAAVTDGKRGWRRMLEGMPFMRYDSLEDKPVDAPEIPGPDGDVVKTTLPLHAAAHLFLKHGYILLFDEIQLVNVASAGLLRRTLEAYWRLGGVVIGTSNRIPRDLYASNVQRGQLTQFLEILGERCPNFEMRKTRDFRREPFYREEWLRRKQQERGEEADAAEDPSRSSGDSVATASGADPGRRATYFVRGEEDLFRAAADDAIRGREGTPATVEVYGRKLAVPFSISASDDGPSVCRFTFEQLCDSPLGPADYLTLASTYHTFIVDDVPQLTLMQKNQARRFITLLDAVYEAGCRLVLQVDSSPDDLFFPDAKEAARHAVKGASAGPGTIVKEIRGRQYVTSRTPGGSFGSAEADDVVDMSANGGINPFLTPPAGQGYPEEEALAAEQAQRRQKISSQQRVDVERDKFMSDNLIQMETLSEALQDTEEGFRPNILPYDESRPDRSAGAGEALDRQRRGSAPASLADTADEAALQRERELSDKVGFKHLAIFSGEDERFAYQRAVSRLFEMSHPDWVVRKSWRPFLHGEMNSWKGSEAEKRERMRELGQVDAVDAAAATGTAAASANAGEIAAAAQRNDHLDAARSRLSGAKATVRPVRHTPPGLEVEGDFADEVSYEAATFPGRLADPSYWTEEDQRYYDQPNRGASNAGLPEDGRPSFEAGPVGRRNREGLPVLSDVHFWGVREDWGKKAGPWGKGATVFESKEDEQQAAAAATSARQEAEQLERQPDAETRRLRPSLTRPPASSAAAKPTPGPSAPFHPTGRRSFSTASSPSPPFSSASSHRRRLFSTSRRTLAKVVADHYKTLQVQRSVSKAQIKAQFYKLSKELHPDVNPSEDAKLKFQQVSEAYATLGNESARRGYDRDMSASSSHYAPDSAQGGERYQYDPNSNASRRARATYAWNHTRRASPPPHSSTSSTGRQTHSSIFTHPKTTHFETLAARQRRREELNSNRDSGRSAQETFQDWQNIQADKSSNFIRFFQVGIMLFVVFKAGTMFVGPNAVGNQGRET